MLSYQCFMQNGIKYYFITKIIIKVNTGNVHRNTSQSIMCTVMQLHRQYGKLEILAQTLTL